MVESHRERLHVLAICGWGRSGSTILDRVLGQLPGFVSVGELRSLWDTDPLIQRCGCGEVIAQCPRWNRILTPILGEVSARSFGDVATLRNSIARTRDIPSLARIARSHLRGAGALDSEVPEREAYGAILERIYSGVMAETGARVVVDSSKHPADALLLASRGGMEVTVLHLVRDPRAVAFSWHRRAPRKDDATVGSGTPPHRGVASSSAWWTIWNGLLEFSVRPAVSPNYQRIRYEDLVAAPSRALGTLLERCRVTPDDLRIGQDGTVLLEKAHTVAGNPSRFMTGPTRLAIDCEWRREMPLYERRLATLATLPLLHHYGYRLSNDRGPGTPNGRE